MATVELVASSTSRSPGLSARSLGLTPMHEPGGTTQAKAEENVQKLNDYFATGWVEEGKNLDLDGCYYAIWGTIVIEKEGFRINGTGTSDSRAQSQRGGITGATAKFVNIKPANPCMLQLGAAYITIDGVGFDGWWDADSLAEMQAATENHALIGIEQLCQHDGIGTGKAHFPSGLTITTCIVAIKWGDNPAGDNADQWYITTLRTMDCGTGILCITQQSVNHRIGHYEATRTGTALHWIQGGGSTLGALIVENGPNPVGLKVRAQNYDSGYIRFDELKADGSITGTADLVVIDAPEVGENTPAFDVSIGRLTVSYNIANRPKFKLRGFCRLMIYEAGVLFDNMVTVYGGSATFFPMIFLQNARFRDDDETEGAPAVAQDPSDFVQIDTAADGKCRVVLRNNSNEGNVPFNDESFYLVRSAGSTSVVPYDPTDVE